MNVEVGQVGRNPDSLQSRIRRLTDRGGVDDWMNGKMECWSDDANVPKIVSWRKDSPLKRPVKPVGPVPIEATNIGSVFGRL